MRVKIGKYKSPIGPYQVAEWFKYVGASENRIDKIGDRLASSKLVASLCDLYNDMFGKRDIKIHIDPYDTWSMDNTLALIILPMLKQLKQTKHGSPMVDDEDVPSQLRHGNKDCDDNWVHYKWDFVLNEIIWAFEQINDEDWEDQFIIERGELDFEDYPEDEGKLYKPVRWKKPYVVDREGIKRHQARIDNGLRLFGRYYRNLWA